MTFQCLGNCLKYVKANWQLPVFFYSIFWKEYGLSVMTAPYPSCARSCGSSKVTQNVKITMTMQSMNISKIHLSSIKKPEISVRENYFFPGFCLSSQYLKSLY